MGGYSVISRIRIFMQRSQLFSIVTFVFCLTAAGCGGDGFSVVPVSGVVTLDGKPLAGARIGFEPRATEGLNAGPGSYGETDGQGRFELVTLHGRKGAVAASHRVTISTYRAEQDRETGAMRTVSEERVPQRYSEREPLEFTVPKEGTAAANFELQSP